MKTSYLHLNSRDEFLRIDVSKIVYFEADGNYTNIIQMNKLKGVVCMNLAHMQEVLTKSLGESARIFARIGKKSVYAFIFYEIFKRFKKFNTLHPLYYILKVALVNTTLSTFIKIYTSKRFYAPIRL